MSPTIVVKDGKVRLVGGAAGGPRIITATTQCILNCLIFDMTAGEAIDAPRIHHRDVAKYEAALATAQGRAS